MSTSSWDRGRTVFATGECGAFGSSMTVRWMGEVTEILRKRGVRSVADALAVSGRLVEAEILVVKGADKGIPRVWFFLRKCS